MLREGKATITAEVTDILARIGSSAEAWQSCMLRLRGGRLLGRFIAGSRELLRSTAEQLGVKRLVNLSAARPPSRESPAAAQPNQRATPQANNRWQVSPALSFARLHLHRSGTHRLRSFLHFRCKEQ